MNKFFIAIALSLCSLGSACVAQAQGREEQVVRSASAVLNQAMAAPLKAIPRAMLHEAQGVAIIPNVIKGGLIIGARHGEGVLIVRDEQGAWQPPVFISLTGGNFGWQIGIQASDLVLVFKTRQSVQGILNGKLTLGVDAAAAAGPVGRQAAAATDGQLKAEIYTYSRSRGLFAGISIDGSMIRVEPRANAVYYQSAVIGQPAVVPASAMNLIGLVAAYSGGGDGIVQTGANELQPVAQLRPPANIAADAEAARAQLAAGMPGLEQLLDPQWTQFLSLPPEVFMAGSEPALEPLQTAVERYEQVAQNPQYATLAARPEFQAMHSSLQHYVALRAQAAHPLQLPPPPATGSPAQ